jgi:hypothetical protein
MTHVSTKFRQCRPCTTTNHTSGRVHQPGFGGYSPHNKHSNIRMSETRRETSHTCRRCPQPRWLATAQWQSAIAPGKQHGAAVPTTNPYQTYLLLHAVPAPRRAWASQRRRFRVLPYRVSFGGVCVAFGTTHAATVRERERKRESEKERERERERGTARHYGVGACETITSVCATHLFTSSSSVPFSSAAATRSLSFNCLFNAASDWWVPGEILTSTCVDAIPKSDTTLTLEE